MRTAKSRAPYAFCGSWALTLSHVVGILGAESCEGFVGQCPGVAREIEEAETAMRLAGGNSYAVGGRQAAASSSRQ